MCGRGMNDVRGFLTDHVHGRDDKESGDLREDGRIDDPKTADAVDLEVRVHYATLALRTDRARTGGVVPPGVVFHEISDLIVGLFTLARQFLLRDQSLTPQMLRQFPYKLDPFDHGAEIVAL